MANMTLSLTLLCILVLLSSFNLGGNMAQEPDPGQPAWCVAKPSASEAELNNNINFVCTELGLECSIIQENGPCHLPNNVVNHASVVMNLYFQIHGHSSHNCYFSNSGLMVVTNPSYGNCIY